MKAPFRVALAMVALLLLWPVGHWLKNHAGSSEQAAAVRLETAAANDGRATRGATQDTWRLPFSLPPRLTAEQKELLLRDPRKAVEAHASDEQWSTHLAFLSAWAELDPETAAAWVDGQNDESRGIRLAAIVAGIMGRPHGLDEADQFLALHADDKRLLPKFQGEGLRWLVFQQVDHEETIAPAMEYIRTHPGEGLAERLVASLSTPDQQVAALNYFSAKGVKFDFYYTDLAMMMEREAKSFADWSSLHQPELLEDLVSAWHLSDKSHAPEHWIENSTLDDVKKEVLKKRLQVLHQESDEE